MGQARRRLFTLAVRDYAGAPAAFAEGIDAQLTEVRTWWCAPELGERGLVPHDLGEITSREDVEDAVRAAGLHSLTADDVAVVYVTGHGTHGSSGRHYLALPATPAGGFAAHGFRTADLVTAVLASEAEHVLVIVNACFAGELLGELAEFRRDLPPRRRKLRSLAVFATADFDERPQVHEFTTLMAEVRHWLRTRAEYADEWLSFDDFAAELDRARDRLAELDPAEVLQVWRAGPADGPSPCLPNPGYRQPDIAVAPARRQVATGAAELDYWLDRASGRVSTGDPGWYFTGRRALTAQVARFLTGGSGLLLVTGAAGTGKSAIVARAVTLTDPEFRTNPRYADAVAAAPPDTVPPPGTVVAAVLARNKTTAEVAEQLVLALGGEPVRTTDASTQVARLREQLAGMLRDRVGAVVLDGLDEAVNPPSLVTELVGPLTGTARMVVGVRSATPGPDVDGGDRALLDLLRRRQDDVPVTELRTDGQDAHDDIAAYLSALLVERYAGDLGELARLAGLVADQVTPSFLDARFAAQRLRDSDKPRTSDDPDLLAEFNEGTVSLLRRDIADTATADHPGAQLLAVLRAAAFARGGGVPWADIWPAVASAVRDGPVADATVAHVVGSRLEGYLARDVEDGRVVHRPVHESLAEVLRDAPHRLVDGHAEEPPAAPHQRIARRLVRLLPTSPELAPHPYLRRHLVEHARLGEVLDDATVPSALLPWETSGEVRAALGLPLGSASEQAVLRAWATIEPFVSDASPEARALSLDVARTAQSGAPTDVVRPPGLHPRWAHWRHAGDVLARTPSPAQVIAVVPLLSDLGPVATGEAAGTVRLWDPGTGRELLALTGHSAAVTAIAAPRNSWWRTKYGPRRLATGDENGTVRLWDLGAARETAVLTGHNRGVLALSWVHLPNGAVMLASADADGTIRLWDPTTGRLKWTHTTRGGAVTTLTAASSLLVSGGEDGIVRVWDVIAGREIHAMRGHFGAVRSLTTVDKELVTSGGDEGLVLLWDPVLGTLQRTLTGHTGSVRALSPLAARGPAVVSGSDDGTIRLWHPRTGRPLGTVTAHADRVRGLVALDTMDGDALVSVAEDGVVRIWPPDPAGAGPESDRTGSPHSVAAVVLPGGHGLATADEAGTVRLWDAKTGTEVGEPRAGYTGGSLSSALVPAAGDVLLATTAFNGSVRLWNPETGAPVGSPLSAYGRDHRWAPTLAAVLRGNGEVLLATGDEDGAIRLWEAGNGDPADPTLHCDAGWSGAIAAVSTSDDRDLLVTGHHDGTVRVWDAVTGDPAGPVLTGHRDSVRTAAAVPLLDGRLFVATGSDDGTVRFWDLTSGTERTRIVVGAPVRGLAAVPSPPAAASFLAVVGPAGIAMIDVTGV